MSFQLNVPPSVISRMAKNAEPEPEEDDEPKQEGKKREDWRKLKELEEARKAGTAPAMQDEEGRDINPHIPQYIMQAPWYFGATQPTLSHQRPQDEKQKLYTNDWFKKGLKEGPVATKYRKGACENCGAMTHKKKDCLERPRKIGAKFTGRNFAPDEHLTEDMMEFSYEGKRDRWNGYDTAEHKRIFEEFQKIDEAKRLLKAQKIEELVQSGEIGLEEAKKAVEVDDEDDEDKYAEDVDMPGQKFESKQRITVRNLRIREDTAKYLYNLNVDSAYYDPKTRSMRENPLKQTGKDHTELPYAGDNFVRWSGDAMEMAKQQLFAWEAYEKGSEVNLQADPTKLDMLTREYQRKKEQYTSSAKEGILEKYGGQEHLDAPPKQLMEQTEEYVEYSRTGTVLKGQEKATVLSIYEEDIFPNNHTSVWGSYWKDGQWGFQCCCSFVRESYCTGAAGQAAEQTSIPSIDAPPPMLAIRERLPSETQEPGTSQPAVTVPDVQEEEESDSDSSSSDSSEEERRRKKKEKKREKKKKRKQKEKERKKKKKNKKNKKRKHSSGDSESDSESEDEEAKRERRILKAIRKEEERLHEVDQLMELDERNRPYNLTYDFKAPTEEDVEAFQRKRLRDDDPMARFMK